MGCHCSISRCGFSITCSQCLYSLSTFTQYPRCTVPNEASRILPRCLTLNMSVICGSLSECMSNTNASLKFGVRVLCAVFVMRLLSFLPQKVTSSLTNGSEKTGKSISKLSLISPCPSLLTSLLQNKTDSQNFIPCPALQSCTFPSILFCSVESCYPIHLYLWWYLAS